MKKLVLISIVTGVLSVSCKKDYVCTCTTTDNGTPEATTVSELYATKGTAKKACDKGNMSVGVLVTTCELN